VLYTMLDSALAERLQTKCREFSIPCLSILDPVLGLFQSYLGAESARRVGDFLYHPLQLPHRADQEVGVFHGKDIVELRAGGAHDASQGLPG